MRKILIFMDNIIRIFRTLDGALRALNSLRAFNESEMYDWALSNIKL